MCGCIAVLPRRLGALQRCLPAGEASRGLSGLQVTCPLTPQARDLYLQHFPRSNLSAIEAAENTTMEVANSETSETSDHHTNETTAGAQMAGGWNDSSSSVPAGGNQTGACSIPQERWTNYNHAFVATRSLAAFMQVG